MIFLKKLLLHAKNREFYRIWYGKFKSLFIQLHPIPNPVIFMTLLVKNEEDIIEENLIFHKAMGVDGFIVTDNNSSDNTPVILSKYLEKGWVKEIIKESGDDHRQEKWVDRMILLAKNIYKADWVINADADELWYSQNGNLKMDLCRTTKNILICSVFCVIPEKGKYFWQWADKVKIPLKNAEGMELSKYSIYTQQIPKVVHRTCGYKNIFPGNHWVEMKWQKATTKSGIIIYHYPIRSFSQFSRKVVNGGISLSRNPDRKVGQHWRYLYDIYIQGGLQNEYKKILGYDQIDILRKNGIVENDLTIPVLMNNLLNNLL